MNLTDDERSYLTAILETREELGDVIATQILAKIRDAEMTAVLRKSPLLSDEERAVLRDEVAQDTLDCAFGDGQNEEYVWEGVTMVGVNHMTDLELLEAHGHYDAEADTTPESKATAWRRELSEGVES